MGQPHFFLSSKNVDRLNAVKFRESRADLFRESARKSCNDRCAGATVRHFIWEPDPNAGIWRLRDVMIAQTILIDMLCAVED